MTEGGDKARAEFLSEAQELVENLSRNLLSLEQGRAGGGRIDPEYLNEAFRSVHTLKSLSGLFGDKHMSQLSHRLEDLLDDLRLGRQQLSDAVLDLLFTSVDVYWQILTSSRCSSYSVSTASRPWSISYCSRSPDSEAVDGASFSSRSRIS
ncbi:MAG TPA: Hpt domain-containing protein [Polyangiaceae bacterium]|nr:Hpt domain-containing protein [Polyangiaceae bacterium]